MVVRALVAVLCLVFALPPCAVAATGFGATAVVARSGAGFGAPPSAAMTSGGRGLVVWTGDATRAGGRALARNRFATGRWGAKQVLSQRGVGETAAALHPDGTAAAAWVRHGAHGVRYVEASVALPPLHRFGRAQRLVTVRANVVSVQLVAADGRIVAVWHQGVPGKRRDEVRYAIAGRDGRFGPPRTLAVAYLSGGVHAAVARDGNVIAAWQTPLADGADTQVAVAALAPGATDFGAAQVVSSGTQQELPGSEALASGLFAGPGGLALGYSVQGTLPWLLRVATRGADGSFKPETAAEVDDEQGTASVDGPVVALPATGGLVAAWTVTRQRTAENQAPVSGTLLAAPREADGTFATPVRLSSPGAIARYPTASALSETAIVAWGEGRFDRLRLRYALRRGGRFSAGRTLATGAVRGVALAGSDHHAIAAWAVHGGVRAAVMAG
jgi:hypothetical protein